MSSNQKNLGTAGAPRNREELDGTLLLPVATHVQVLEEEGPNTYRTPEAPTTMATATVVPSTEAVFEYDAALAKEERLQRGDQQQQQQQQKQQQEDADDDATVLAEGVVLPENNHATQHNYAGVSDDSRPTIQNANRAGVLKSHAELNAIRNAQHRLTRITKHDVSTMQDANATAHRRDREGLQIQNDHIGDSGTKSKSNGSQNANQHQQSSPAPAATTTRNPTQSQSRGYQVNEYDVRAYDTNSYEVKEYKSVYD